MNRKFIVGPPGTGKTRYLVDLYYDKIQTYDIEKTQAKILEAGLPDRLANRLESGR